jgi:hypothetical protein
MRSKIVIIWFVLLLTPFLSLCLSSANAADASQQEIVSDDNTIQVGVYAISIGNFEFTKGTYVIDFYLVFKWSNQNITPASFELMNGRASSTAKIYESITNDSSEVWYRIQANLFINPEFKNYPFDSQDLKIIIEDSKYNSSVITYSPLTDVSGVDDRFKISGWNIQTYDLSVEKHGYPWEEEYSQLVFTIKLERETGPTAIKLLLPPIIFCIVSGLSFFFKADKITHRLGLGTSMLISAVMFHLSQTSSLPALPSLILIDKIMISVYAFLASSLFATTLIYVDEEFWKKVDYTKQVNRFGAIFTIVIPFVIFAILYFG